MTERHLTITCNPDWIGALRTTGVAAKADIYQGEFLNFKSVESFFEQLSAVRWEIVLAAQGKGKLSVLELALAVKRDVKFVEDDAMVLVELGLLECVGAAEVVSHFRRYASI